MNELFIAPLMPRLFNLKALQLSLQRINANQECLVLELHEPVLAGRAGARTQPRPDVLLVVQGGLVLVVVSVGDERRVVVGFGAEALHDGRFWVDGGLFRFGEESRLAAGHEVRLLHLLGLLLEPPCYEQHKVVKNGIIRTVFFLNSLDVHKVGLSLLVK